jgi:hypothetical protein
MCWHGRPGVAWLVPGDVPTLFRVHSEQNSPGSSIARLPCQRLCIKILQVSELGFAWVVLQVLLVKSAAPEYITFPKHARVSSECGVRERSDSAHVISIMVD